MNRFAAAKGRYRVLGVDTFDGDENGLGEYDTLEEAKTVAKQSGGVMYKTHVYDDTGRHLYEAGSF